MTPKTGRYKATAAFGTVAEVRLELGPQPNDVSQGIVSGDVQVGSRTVSFLAKSRRGKPGLIVTKTGSSTRIDANVRFGPLNFETGTWGTATLTFRSPTEGELQLVCPTGRDRCNVTVPLRFQDKYFRDLVIELDRSPTAVFPSRVNWRKTAWDLKRIFQMAGLKTRVIRGNRSVPEQSPDWNDGELHSAMLQWRQANRQPWWCHVLLVGSYEDDDPNSFMFGIMFDVAPEDGSPAREGCAVFVNGLAGYYGKTSTRVFRRELLMTIAHEVGHALNLLHSFDKERADSPSLMNYPDEFEPDEDAYYKAFNFAFDRQELVHMRHHSAVVAEPGNPDGIPWGIKTLREAQARAQRARRAQQNARRQVNPLDHAFEQSMRARLKLGLSLGDTSLLPGEPVYGQVELRRTNVNTGRIQIQTSLDWASGQLALELRKAGSTAWQAKAPPIRRCRRSKPRNLKPGDVLRSELPLVYSAQGDIFPTAGQYEVRARLTIRKGLRVATLFSPPVSVTVRAPADAPERSLCRLYRRRELKQLVLLRGGTVPDTARAAALRVVELAPASMGGQLSALALASDRASRTLANGVVVRTGSVPSARPTAVRERMLTPAVAAAQPARAEVEALLGNAARGRGSHMLASSISRVRTRLDRAEAARR